MLRLGIGQFRDFGELEVGVEGGGGEGAELGEVEGPVWGGGVALDVDECDATDNELGVV
jgi:hypothetical protein